MTVRSVVVAHREPLAAEGIAAALARFPALLPVGVASSAAEAERRGTEADAVALDERLPGAGRTAAELRRRGVRVVMLVDGAGADGSDGSVRVPSHATVRELAAALAPGVRGVARASELSSREEEVLALVAKGLPGKQVARRLGISPKTVEQHKTRIFAKLGVPNQAAAVAMAATRGGLSWSPFTT